MKYKFLLLIPFWISLWSFGQNSYEDYIYNLESHFDSLLGTTPDSVKIPGYKQYVRYRKFWDTRVEYSDKIEEGSYTKYYEALRHFPRPSNKSVNPFQWNFVGPGDNVINTNQHKGRVECVCLDKTDPTLNTIYAGTNQSGLWKTTDKGAHWTCISDNFLNYGIGVMGIDKASDGAIYILTGGNLIQFGTGIYRSEDNGENWTQVLAFDPNEMMNGYTIKVDPNDPNTIYASINSRTNSNIYRTLDRGITWDVIFSFDDTHILNNWKRQKSIQEIFVNSNNSNQVLFLSKEQPAKKFEDVVYLDERTSASIWRTENAKTTDPANVVWARKDGGLLNISNPNHYSYFYSRFALSQDMQDPSHLYVGFYYKNNKEFDPDSPQPSNIDGYYIYESNDFGDTFSPFYSYSSNIGAGHWMHELQYSLANSDYFYVAGIGMVRIDMSASIPFYEITSGIDGQSHDDKRDLISYINPVTGYQEILLGTDGGVSLSVNDASFQDISGEGLDITQFFGIDICESDPEFLAGGTQDNNGFILSDNQWTKVHGGDNYDFLVNDSDPTEYYHIENGGNGNRVVGPDGTKRVNYNAHIVQYPGNFSKVLVGGEKSLLRTTDKGDTWQYFYQHTNPDLRQAVKCIDVCESNENVVWFANQGPTWGEPVDNKLYKTTNDGGDWDDMTDEFMVEGVNWKLSRYLSITDIVIHPDDPNTVWIAFGNFVSGSVPTDGKLRIVKTIDGGQTWTDIGKNTNLPYLPINVLKGYRMGGQFHILAGNDEGVYQLRQGSSDWQRISEGMPNVNVQDIEVNYSGQAIYIATFGRGIWKADIPCETAISTLEVNATETWDSPRLMNQHIKVLSGNTLNLTDALYMCENTKIWVEPGAELIVDGGLISSACDEPWHGIVLLGNRTMSQTAANQGKLSVKNGAVLENAEYAVTNLLGLDGGSYTASGGIIYANKAIFRNNITDVRYSGYHNINSATGVEMANQSLFTECQFETTNDYLPAYTNAHISMSHVNGIRIKGSTFEDKRTGIDYLVNGRDGIYAHESGFNLIELCKDFMQNPNTPCQNIVVNQFKNLRYGVKAYGLSTPAQFSIDIKKNEFDCVNGVYLMDISNAEIHQNNFVEREELHTVPSAVPLYGLYLDFCTNYDVEGNTFQGIANGLPENLIGVVVKNQHSANTRIYRNSFDGLGAAIEAIGQNKHPDWSMPTGLVIQCNEYENAMADMYITKDVNNPGVTNGIALNQGVNGGATTELAGNLFGTASNGHIYNGSGCGYFAYYHHQSASNLRVKPTITQGSFNIIETQVPYSSSSCPDNLSVKIKPKLKASSEQQTIAVMEEALNNLVDDSGYESYDNLEEQEKLAKLSSKEYLGLAQAKARHDYSIQKEVREAIEAGLEEGAADPTEEVLELLTGTNEPGFELQKVQILDSKQRYAEANVILEKLSNANLSGKEQADIQDYTEVRDLLKGWKQAGKDMQNLAEADINVLKTFVNKQNISAARAMVVLAANDKLDYKEPVYLPKATDADLTVRSYSKSLAGTLPPDFLKLYPNPARDYFTVEYCFASDDKPMVLKVTDIQGKVVYTEKLRQKQNRLLIDSKNLETGMYYISIMAGKRLIKTQSVQVNR